MFILSILIVILLMSLVFKLSWWFIKFTGKLIGFILGAIAFFIVGTVAITVIGLAFVFLPIIFILGVGGLIGLIVKAF